MDKRLFLIDGHALIFKMYYAFLRHPMINSKGADTSILFGFTRYLFELIAKESPTHIAIAFDPPGGTFRNEMYSEYKANRGETPQLVIDALEPLTEICQSLKIPVLIKKGYEADDVIGSMAKRAEKEGFTVYMVTPDKDYGQLISDRIFQYKPGKSGGESEVVGVQQVCAKYGINNPLQVIDMLTICGDASDNVPGVKGVGEKGAGKLISEYGSVDNIYNNLERLTLKQKAAFEDAKDHIQLSRDLVTIKTDIEFDESFKDMEFDNVFDPSISDLFKKYEFDSLRKYISHIDLSSEQKTGDFPKIVSADTQDVIRLIKKAGMCSIIITETHGEGIFSAIDRITVGVEMPEGIMVAESNAKGLSSIMTDGAIAKAGYDLKRQRNLLKNSGIELNGKLIDIELMHYLINPEKSHSIEVLARNYLGTDISQSEGSVSAKPMSLFDSEEDETQVQSKTKEAAVTVLLGKKLIEELRSHDLEELYYNMEEPLIRVLSEMELSGVKIDLNQLRKFASNLASELAQRQEHIREMAGEPELNIMSPRQIGVLLFEKLALDPKVKAKKGTRYSYSTDEETLNSLAGKHPIINEILEYRGVKKLLSTYIEPLPNFISPKTGKVHTTFNQSLTSTGRLSSSKPNLQNIPIRTERGKEIRKAFVASTADGLIMSADYSQIELRIMAHLSKDAHLTEAFRQGLDVHSITASKIFNTPVTEVTADQRRIAKTANFGIMYGISAFGLAQRLKISKAESKNIIDEYFKNFPDISSYIADTIASARENGYTETLFGRRRYLPEINSHNATIRSLAERNAVNAPIQGTAADIIKKAMIEIAEKLKEAGLRSRMVLQIHDELVFDTIPGEVEVLQGIVVREMENVIELSIPLTVECNYGKNWLEAH